MRKVFHTNSVREKSLVPLERENELSVCLRKGTSDFDFGLEVALTWLGQLEARLASLAEPSEFIHSVKAVLGDVQLILLEVSSGQTTILYQDFEMPKSKTKRLCRPKGFYGKLARIRFTKFFNRDFSSTEILTPNGEPPVESLVAVPVFLNGAHVGCLAAASREKNHILGSREAMVLSLAAAFHSLARELRASRG